jgi:hypothetical protein
MTVEYQKVWTTMNDLESVTSKICSAREIIDNAVDKIQGHEYDKAELLMNAAYEFLEYYLQDFDDKFRLAWQATVGDLRDADVKLYDAVMKEREYYESVDDYCDASGLTEPIVKYSDEELNAMCDAAEEQQEKKTLNYQEAVAAGWSMTDDGIWMPPQEKKKWVLPVEEVRDEDTDEDIYCVTFPDDLLEAANLKEGDIVEWVNQGDDSYLLQKHTERFRF